MLLTLIITSFFWITIIYFKLQLLVSSICLRVQVFVQFVQVVEISKGSKVKYELDKKTGLIKV